MRHAGATDNLIIFEKSICLNPLSSGIPCLDTIESFDLEGVDVALNSHVNIFNLLAVFLYDYPPNWIVGPQFTLLLSISCFRFDSLR
jgi:hypothetical protein